MWPSCPREAAHVNTDGPLTATVSDDGAVTLAHRGVDATVAAFREPADRDAYRAAPDRFGAHAAHIGGLLGAELRTRDAPGPVWGLARAAGRSGLEGYARDLAASGRAWLRAHFRGPEVDRLWTPWLLHAGLAPDSASAGLMVPIFAATLHAAGLPVVVGGASNFVLAWERLLDELGVQVHTGRRVERIVVRDGTAAGVAGAGWSLAAERAVLASVTPPALYGDLLPPDAAPAAVRDDAARFRPGRAALQLHVALSGPVPWRDSALAAAPLVHVSDGSSSTAIACAEAEAGLLPRRPTAVVGQQHVLDPSRVPRARPPCGCRCRRCRMRPSATTRASWTRPAAGTQASRTATPRACSTASPRMRRGCATWSSGWTSSPRMTSRRTIRTRWRVTRTPAPPSWTRTSCGARSPPPLGTPPRSLGSGTSARQPTPAQGWPARPGTSSPGGCSPPPPASARDLIERARTR